MAEFQIQTGVINAIRFEPEEEGGRPIAKVDIQSHGDLSIIPDIKIDTPLNAQHIPTVGQVVTFMRTDNYFTRIIAVHGERPFDAPIKPGEVMVESTGGGFMYLDNGGNVIVADETLSNVFKLLSQVGIVVTADSLVIDIKGVGQINVTPKDPLDPTSEEKIEFLKFSSIVGPTKPTSKIVITNDEIVIDASKVKLGREQNTADPFANPLVNPTGGVVVSRSPVVGEFSYDLFTGMPIPKSGTVESTFIPGGS